MLLRIGTRGSPLARWQANWVAGELRALGGIAVEIVEIATQGDVRGQSIAGLSGQGVFTKEIQNSLLAGKVDLAVHSLKDLPTEAVPGLEIAAVPRREATADALISRENKPFTQLPRGATIGTGSARRRAQLLHVRADLVMADIRGNVDTRLRKLAEGQYDAIVLAEAGLTRLGLAQAISELLPETLMLPAIGQGALAIEVRANDLPARDAVRRLDDPTSHQAVRAERALLAHLRGGCLAPIAALARPRTGDQLQLTAAVLSLDGRRRLDAQGVGNIGDAENLGKRVADDLLAQGAAELIAAARRPQ
jgi:hydroxymethylbilane synthase